MRNSIGPKKQLIAQKYHVIFVVLFAAAAIHICPAESVKQRGALRKIKNPTGTRHSFKHEGLERAYRIFIPSSYTGKTAVPLVFAFHGGGGNADVGSKMGLTPVSEKYGFIVVYPEGIDRHWNDGRKAVKFAEQDAEIDDVAFVLSLLDELSRKYKIDAKKVFAAGASNGGFFTHRLAIECADKFSAVAILIATMPKPFEKKFTPSKPVSVLIMNGTEDPFIPYNGGEVTPKLFPLLERSRKKPYGHGFCSSTDTAINLWLKHNALSDKPNTKEMLPDRDTKDKCTVEKSIWIGGKNGIRVALYKVIGGGHTIPGGSQYLPERIIGRTCKDIDAWETVWAFFENNIE